MVCEWWGPRINDKQEICRIINIGHSRGMMHLCLLSIIEPSCYARSEIILSLILAEMLIASKIRPVLKWRVLSSFSVWRKEEINASYCIYNLQHNLFSKSQLRVYF